MNRILIALDVDGVLNSVSDHERLNDLVSAGLPYTEIEDLLSFFTHEEGNRRVRDMGMYVNNDALAMFTELRERLGADVLGVSSWFGGGREPERVATFLGIPLEDFTVCETTGGGMGRCEAIAKYIVEHDYDSLIILDDQPMGWARYNLTPYHVPISGRTGLLGIAPVLITKAKMAPIHRSAIKTRLSE